MADLISKALDAKTKEQAEFYLKKLSAARSALRWKEGDLDYKLLPHQKELYASLISAIENKTVLKYVVNSSRRFGKSFVLCLIACEFALQQPGSYIRFAAPSGVQIREILHQHMRKICEDAPPNIKPIMKGHIGKYVFPNGSEITFAGVDGGHAENLRGNASHLNILDEAGSMDDLMYVLNDILLPQTLTTRGTTLIASTPPRSPAHEFCDVAREAEIKGNYSKFTIYDNTSIKPDELKLYIEEAGGKESTTFKREYLCQFIVDSNLALCREWSPDFIKNDKRDPYYVFYDKYVAMDIGVRDFTALIFGYYNFMEARLYIQDEITLKGQDVTTLNIAKEVKDKEKELWVNCNPKRSRISDSNNLILLQDLQSQHNINFSPTNKDQLEAMVNELRMWVGAGKVVIDPKCKQLIGCLEYGIWDAGAKNSKVYKGFARAAGYGHFDHLAALIYLIRNIDPYNNPIPPNLGKTIENSLVAYQDNKTYMDSSSETLDNIYGKHS